MARIAKPKARRRSFHQELVLNRWVLGFGSSRISVDDLEGGIGV